MATCWVTARGPVSCPPPASGRFSPTTASPHRREQRSLFGFSNDSLYVGVIAYDDDPGAIIVTDSRRDSYLGNTDAFLMIIDGLLDRQNGFVFGTNAAGILYDGQVTQEGTGGNANFGVGGINLNWDATWQVQSKIGEFGWSAEFEIPFNTLRFGNGKSQDWGINFQRNIRRNNEVAFWAPLERNRNLYRVSEAGTLRGIEPPSQRNLQITPYGLARSRSGGDLDGTETDTEFGIRHQVFNYAEPDTRRHLQHRFRTSGSRRDTDQPRSI